MNRRIQASNTGLLPQIATLTLLVSFAAAPCAAQGPGGGPFGRIPSPEESFRSLDRNDNGQVDPEEWESLPPFLRGIWEREGVDLASPLSYDDFIDKSEAMRERMQNGIRGGPGGSGPGAAPGGGGGGREGDRDRGGRRGGGDGDRGRGGPRGGGGPGFGADDDLPPAGGDGKDAKPQAKPKVKMTMKLPDSYRSKDKDNDGQIGLYEWPRNDYAGFRKLDHNGDGFLTPHEIARGPRSVAVASNSSPTRGASSGSSSGTSAATSTSSSDSGASSGSSSGSKTAGEKAFDLLDKDKNTTISEEEWKKSLSTGPAFKKAGIAVSFPLPRGEFLRLYPQAYPPK